MSSLVTTKFLLVSNTNHSLLVAWSPVQADFKVYRVLFNSSTPEAPVSLEHRYSGSSAFDQIFEVGGALVVALDSGTKCTCLFPMVSLRPKSYAQWLFISEMSHR